MFIIPATGLNALSSEIQTVPLYSPLVHVPCPVRGVLSFCSPSSLPGALYCATTVLLPHTCRLGSLPASIGAASIHMSCSHPTAFLICSYKYCSDHRVVPHMHFALHIMSLPVFVTQLVYEHPLWLLLLGPTITPCIPSPLFLLDCYYSCSRKKDFLSIIVLIIFFWWASRAS